MAPLQGEVPPTALRTDDAQHEDADSVRALQAPLPFRAGDRVRLSNLGTSPFNGVVGVVLEKVPCRPGAEARWAVDVPGRDRPIRLPALNLLPEPSPAAAPSAPRADDDLIEDAIRLADAERSSQDTPLQPGDRVGLFNLDDARLNGLTGVVLRPVAPRNGMAPRWYVEVPGKPPLRLKTAHLARLPPAVEEAPAPRASAGFTCCACNRRVDDGSDTPHPGAVSGDPYCTAC